MITLANTTDKIQIFLSSSVTTNNINCYTAYRDTTTTSISPIGFYTASNGTSAIDIVPSPAASTQRLVEYISIHNTDTQPTNAFINYNDNGTNYTLYNITLQPQDRLEYSDKNGFKVLSSVGTLKSNDTQVLITANASQSVSVLDRDITFSCNISGSFINTELAAFGFPVETNGLYAFDLLAFYDVSSTTNGARFNLLGDTSGDLTAYYYWKSLTTTSFTAIYAISQPLTVPSTYDASSPATTANIVIKRGFYRAGKNDFVKLWFAPEEVSPSTITLKAGTRIHFYKVA
jgi:hypothetical protein